MEGAEGETIVGAPRSLVRAHLLSLEHRVELHFKAREERQVREAASICERQAGATRHVAYRICTSYLQ